MNIKTVAFDTTPKTDIIQGRPVKLEAQLITEEGTILSPEQLQNYVLTWSVSPSESIQDDPQVRGRAQWIPRSSREYEISLTVSDRGDSTTPSQGGMKTIRSVHVEDRADAASEPRKVTLVPAGSARTNDDVFYQSIRESTRDLDFSRYQQFVDRVMCQGIDPLPEPQKKTFNAVNARRASVFPGVDAYQRLKVATEVYVMLSVQVLRDYKFDGYDAATHENKHGQTLTLAELQGQWTSFLESENGTDMLPIDDLVRSRLKESIIPARNGDVTACQGLLQEKLRRPCFFELIWSYWHEEGMLVQTMKAIALRFQNQRTSERDPLANFDVAPLHPLSNLLWGYIQDEQHRLTVPRRAYEYDHEYGISLDGKVVPTLRSADSRSKFLEAFHNLLHGALLFYKLADDTTKRADAFPVLNGLKEVHLLLREGMHNQFGDLPSTARQEMLIEQWILARPEMRDFLGGRAMMPYSEDWMERVDAMKKLQGWTDVSVTYFNELAEFGEQLLLSIRHGDWSNIHDAAFAAHWANELRPEIQQYIHAYRTVTGVDLSPDQADVRLAADRYVQPSVHLRKRLAAQRQAADPTGFGSPRRTAAAFGSRGNRSGASNGAGQPADRREMEFSEDF